PVSAFPGFTVPAYQPDLHWWIYTNGAGTVAPGDLTDTLGHNFSSLRPGLAADPASVTGELVNLYSTYYSNMTNYYGHPQCGSTRVTSTPTNWAYLCSPLFDSFAKAMASA